MIVFALDTESVTPPPSGARYEIDRTEAWWTRYAATMGQAGTHAAYTRGLPVHNWIRWRNEFARALATVTADAERWLATRPAQNVVPMRRKAA